MTYEENVNSPDKIGVEIFTIYLSEDQEYTPLELEQFFQDEVKERNDENPALFYRIMTQTDWDDDSASSSLNLLCYRWETDEEFERRQERIQTEKKIKEERVAQAEKEKTELLTDPDFLLFQTLHVKYNGVKNKHKL